jgi:hypothetical protein
MNNERREALRAQAFNAGGRDAVLLTRNGDRNVGGTPARAAIPENP